ncbi:MAG TPA: hypothetical protein VGK73_27225 [Polyangiaceae bacterium]
MHSLRLRPARVDDAEQLLEVLALPNDGYGPTPRAGLAHLVGRLLRERALTSPLLEERATESDAPHARLQGVALTAFVDLAEARALLTSPPERFVDALFEREQAGESVFLRPSRLPALNRGEGLGLVFLGYRLAPPPEGETADRQIFAMFESFRLFYAGCHCPLALHPAPSSPRAEQSMLGLRFRPVGDGRNLWQLREEDLADAPFNPFIVIRRAPAPRLGFTAGEQELLFCALLGFSDAEVAEHLGLSVETVRKRWRSAFDRATAHDELKILPYYEGTTRGPEKRGALLEYLDAHLEELRPYAD